MPTLGALIEEVEAASPSPEPLAQLATATATAQSVDDVTDAMLSHFVDRARHAGHSWAEIGTALGVTKQAVQKRFTGERLEPLGWERFTPRARRLVQDHAPAAAAELGHNWIGTEHLLLGFFAELDALAPKVLVQLGVDREKVVAGITARIESDASSAQPGFTPRAWTALAGCIGEALSLGHNYVGTEHQLLALLHGVGGVAAEVLADADVTYERALPKVIEHLAGYVAKQPR
jgi:hypothetical protein